MAIRQAAASALKGMQISQDVAAGKSIGKHKKLFNVRNLGNRHLLQAGLMVEPRGIERADGHLLCRQHDSSWCFMQDANARTMYGPGEDILQGGHIIKVSLFHELSSRAGTGRLRRVADKLNWRLTAAAVVSQKRWQDAISQLPSDVQPISLSGHQLPVLMCTNFMVDSDADRQELLESLAAHDISSLYRAYRFGRDYYTPFEGVVHVTDSGEGYTLIQVDPVEDDFRRPLVYHLVPGVSVIHVDHGTTVEAGTKLFSLFPRDGSEPTGRYAFDSALQMEEMDKAYGIEAINALNMLHFHNETVTYSDTGKRIAVPLFSALRLPEKVREKFVPPNRLYDDLVYDLTPVCNLADDDTHTYMMVPILASSVRGRRWMADIMLDVDVKLG